MDTEKYLYEISISLKKELIVNKVISGTDKYKTKILSLIIWKENLDTRVNTPTGFSSAIIDNTIQIATYI